ncbi:MAG: YqeG family HAD IIIA-type phosphatase [Coriobacteriia bacterium]|nr:YqeG family HAD IIIA-type phosphatase [Coriobacteriia bacterium]
MSPDLYLRSVCDIDLDALGAQGIDTLLMDLDNTLLPRDSSEMPDDIVAWAAQLSDRGFRVCLVSNNWHARVQEVAKELGFQLVAKAVKPLPFAFWRALKLMGVGRKQCAIVGDQMFTDVLGGKLLGIKTIMVLPLSESDLPHTLLLRRVEKVLLGGRQPQA